MWKLEDPIYPAGVQEGGGVGGIGEVGRHTFDGCPLPSWCKAWMHCSESTSNPRQGLWTWFTAHTQTCFIGHAESWHHVGNIHSSLARLNRKWLLAKKLVAYRLFSLTSMQLRNRQPKYTLVLEIMGTSVMLTFGIKVHRHLTFSVCHSHSRLPSLALIFGCWGSGIWEGLFSPSKITSSLGCMVKKMFIWEPNCTPLRV